MPGRILLADDEEPVRRLLSRLFERGGFTVEQVVDGAQAVAYVRDHPVDLVVLDVRMPRMDGFEACRAIRQLPKGDAIPILMLTGLDDEQAVGTAFDCGASDFAGKTATRSLLMHRVRYLLRMRDTLDRLRSSEERLAQAQQTARIGSWEWDVATGALQGSAQIPRLFGREPAAGGVSTLEALLADVEGDDRAAVLAAVQDAVVSGRSFGFDIRIAAKESPSRIMHLQANAVTNADGQVTGLRGTLQDVTERSAAQDRIRFLAYYDNLTGLPNRVLFRDRLNTMLASARRKKQMVATLFVDLDNFKSVNDALGHSAGDELLAAVGIRFRDAIRVTDAAMWEGSDGGSTVARLGGDEFILALGEIERAADITVVARRVIESLHEPVHLPTYGEVSITASIGISVFPQDGQTVEDLLKHADAAVYHAKDSGRNGFQFYSAQLNQAALQRMLLEGHLKRAIERREFQAHYQPQIDVSTGQVMGAEALLRWQHPELGLVPPSQFIQVAEECGAIHEIGMWVFEAACGEAASWLKEGGPGRVAVNLSPQQFRRPDLVQNLRAAANRAGCDPGRIVLEITESMLADQARARPIVEALRAERFRIVLDDFGTGYSSLAHLRGLPLDGIKIDRSFVRNINLDTRDAAIVGALIGLARDLSLEIMAEGVETTAQRRKLEGMGCVLMQGYLFGRPSAGPLPRAAGEARTSTS